MKVVSLASSSTYGNAYLIGWGSTYVLVDCGVPLRRLESSLVSLGVSPQSLAGILVSHEHSDHVKALQLKTPFSTKYNIPVFAPRELFSAGCGGLGAIRGHVLAAGSTVQIRGLTVSAYGKSHDAVRPLLFRLTAPNGVAAAVVTDLGEVTEEVYRGAHNADYLVFESNHDVQMELDSGRPQKLIRRVLGRFGHLSNAEAGTALKELVGERTQGIMLAHLSLDCNTPHLAVKTVTPYLRRAGFSGLLSVAQAGAPTVLSGGMPDAGHQRYAALDAFGESARNTNT
ncbi:MAG: putative metallo-hydrolase YycJ [Firmicutes bacterium]|nr:putative metallo-hydrolase YycJ [candidate division NPL-UPA2 bacterium]